MSIEFCNDCNQIVEGNTVINYLTPDLNAYQDGEYVLLCGMCGGDYIINLPEDDPREDR